MEADLPVLAEARLRSAVLRGDEAAWEQLYRSCFRETWDFALRRAGGDRSLAEELVQEAWMIAVKRVREFDPTRGRFATWMFGIVRNLARNARRRAGERARREAPAEHLEAVAISTTAVVEPERLERVWGCLPVRDREVLRARFEDEWSVIEIAQRWGETPKAIESLLGRARERFRRLWRRGES